MRNIYELLDIQSLYLVGKDTIPVSWYEILFVLFEIVDSIGPVLNMDTIGPVSGIDLIDPVCSV